MFSITKTIIQEQNIWIPELHIVWAEWDRSATIILPVTGANGEILPPIVANFYWQDFNTFYADYTNDKYLVDIVLGDNGIEFDTSNINDINN